MSADAKRRVAPVLYRGASVVRQLLKMIDHLVFNQTCSQDNLFAYKYKFVIFWQTYHQLRVTTYTYTMHGRPQEHKSLNCVYVTTQTVNVRSENLRRA